MTRSNGESAETGSLKLLVGDACTCSGDGKIGLLLCFIDVCKYVEIFYYYLERANALRLGCVFIFNCCSFLYAGCSWQ